MKMKIINFEKILGFITLFRYDLFVRMADLNDAEVRMYLCYAGLAPFKDSAEREVGVVDITFDQLLAGPLKGFISRVSVSFGCKVFVKGNDILHEAKLELLHILSMPLTPQKLLPCGKEIFKRDDSIISMIKSDTGHSSKEEASTHTHTHTHTRILPLLAKVKDTYLVWYGYYQILPKAHRHSLGQRADTLFIELMEAVATASFLSPQEKAPYVRLAARKTDTLRVLLMVLWETKSLDDKQYIAISLKMEEIGKMLGGWMGQLTKQNSPAKAGEK